MPEAIQSYTVSTAEEKPDLLPLIDQLTQLSNRAVFRFMNGVAAPYYDVITDKDDALHVIHRIIKLQSNLSILIKIKNKM